MPRRTTQATTSATRKPSGIQRRLPRQRRVGVHVQTPRSKVDVFLGSVLLMLSKLLTLGMIFGSGVVFGILIFGLILARYTVNIILQDTGISVGQILTAIASGREESSNLDSTSFLILGTDELPNRSNANILTDTILLGVFSPNASRITTISIQRDLYIASQSAKVNALYQRGDRRTDSTIDPSLVEAVIGGITGVSIDRTIVLDAAAIAALIDALGGVSVTVERSFVDFRFPRSDIDIRTEKDPAKLYETVAFSKGTERMNGERAMRFMRSRHSADPIEGSDDARTRRQQLVVRAVIDAIQDKDTLRNPATLNALLRVYVSRYQQSLPLSELSRLAWQVVRVGTIPSIQSYTLPVKEAAAGGVITHPDRFPGGAWVYIPVDPSYRGIQDLVSSWLQLE